MFDDFDEEEELLDVDAGMNPPAEAGSTLTNPRDNQELLRKRLRDNRELRTLYDLYNPAREGFFTAFIDGKRFNKLVYILEPLGVSNRGYHVLATARTGEFTQKELAEQIGLDKTTMVTTLTTSCRMPKTSQTAE